jgi:prevent-host-death family protein
MRGPGVRVTEHRILGSATMTHMDRIGIREMRQNLSRYAQRARHGESFLITDRGQEVAQLTPAPGRASAIDRLVAERGARRGQGNLLDALAELPAPIAGRPSREVLDELRSERL